MGDIFEASLNPFGIFGDDDGGDAGARASTAEVSATREAIAEQRRQFEETQALLDPFVQAGTRQIGALERGTTAAGLDERLAEIFGTEAFGELRGERERAVQGQLSAGGLTRSGTAVQEIANVPTQLGFDIENLLTGRSQGLVSTGLGAATGVAQFGAQSATAISGLQQDIGRSIGGGIITDQQAAAQASQNRTNTLLSIAGIAAGFSDPRLKKNAEVVGKIVDLDIYEWDWIDAVKDTVIAKCSNLGFMANEVQKKYPHHVKEICGFLTINIPKLLTELERKISCHTEQALAVKL